MYYLQQENSGLLYCGEKPTRFGTKPLWEPNPRHAKQYDTIPAAKEDARSLFDRNPFTSPMRPVSKEVEYVKGSILEYFLFKGFLMIVLRDDSHDDMAEIYEEQMRQELKWERLTEDDKANGRVERLEPESIGALTEAPILGFNVERVDSLVGAKAKLNEDSRIYWYPDYQVTDELERLNNRGYLMMEPVEIEINPTENEDI